MKIIREGYVKSNTKRFHCKKCGCIWEAETGEYEVTSQMAQQHDGIKAYWMICPTCKNCVDVD